MNNVHDLAARGARIRQMIVDATLPEDFGGRGSNADTKNCVRSVIITVIW